MTKKFMDVIRLTESVYVLSSSEGDVNADKEVFIIDTGFNELAEDVIKYAEALGVPKAIFATHGHLDHVLGVKVYKKIWNIPAYIDSAKILNELMPKYISRGYRRTPFIKSFPYLNSG